MYFINKLLNVTSKKLIASIMNNDVKAVEELIGIGANVNYNEKGWSPLMLAAKNGNHQIMKLLIQHGADVEHKNQHGDPALMVADWRNMECINLLIDAKANINTQNKYGLTLLMKSAWLGKVDVASKLISSGADVDIRDYKSMNAYDWAVKYGHTNIAELLI